ncbi:MFS transporter, partial [Onishia taeanensis]
MTERHWLIGVTAVAVVSDAMLLPFYPRFFAERFGVTSAEPVGLYLAASSLVVMLALPAWARGVNLIGTLRLLIGTQIAAGIACLACAVVTSLPLFWALSMLMLVFKASYLLVYPYLIRRTPAERHAATIGLLSVVVHFGGILGAVIGGLVLEHWPASYIFRVMAISDLLQVLVCAGLLARERRAALRPGPALIPEPSPEPSPE